MMMDIWTNRDLYCFIGALAKRRTGCGLTLASYLTNLRDRSRAMRHVGAIATAEFACLLEAAFSPADEGKLQTATAGSRQMATAGDGYAEWRAILGRQIRDLADMEVDGTLALEDRYFGVDAPSGARWYNFDPVAFLECGVAGTFGGWIEGDDTGRAYVPGPMAIVDASGSMTTIDPREFEATIVALREITWQDFAAFLLAGQCFE